MMVRVTLKHVDDDYERIRFDLSINANNEPNKEMMYFGYEGQLNNVEDSHPVMLNQKGVIDLGDGFESSCRFHKTNLLDKVVELKNYVTIWWKYGVEEIESVYIIEGVTILN